ncbi:MAG TPA: DNA polymerase III subunit gamma/tau [Ktedonobacteraceae bacterium]|nr:DNA polymerase III subunit gamma/tau [Ktedonobacteraceae bacterium]
MTSQSLYRKWRSQTFDELVGQEPIIRTLKNALRSDNVKHAYLFTGPRGTGKTSTARLLAKTVNCSTPKDGEPCNECLQCREITSGTSFNVIEIDAASNRGIDNIRDLREKVMMPPSTGKYKVYVLDEAHMLTNEAFNALLKTLEEPPPYAIFVLATTDVHKMLPTVLSRCQRFDFKRISTRQIVKHLLYVSEQENIKLERSAAELIARTAAGGMRDALSLLDQAIAYAGEEISLEHVQVMLGVADARAIFKLITYIAECNSSAILHLIHELSEAGADLRQINAQVVEYWRAVMLARAGADATSILDLTEDEAHDVQLLTQLFTLEELTDCARIFAQNDLVQKNQGTPQLAVELASLECIEVHRRMQSGKQVAAVQARPSISQPAIQVEDPDRLGGHLPDPAPQAQRRQENYGANVHQIGEEAAVRTSQAQDNGARPSLTVQQVRNAWENVQKRVRQRSNGARLSAHLSYFKIVAIEGTAEQPVVAIQAKTYVHHDYLKENDRFKDVEWALTIEFGLECRVHLIPPGQSIPPPQVSDPVSYSTSAAPAVVAQQSAFLERPVSPAYLGEENSDTQEPLSSMNQSSYETSPSDEDSLAKSGGVKENSSAVQTRETIEQHVLRDPVVQEVIKTFTARIADIRPK